MSFSDAVFWVLAVAAVVSAICLLLARSIVRMAFLLLGCLASFAGLYLHLGAGFLGFTQVIVYIGGILILFLFGVMLTARTDIAVRERAGPGLVVPGVLAGVGVLWLLVYLMGGNGWIERGGGGPEILSAPDAPQIGLKLLGTYILPFEAVSMLLLAAMVGATYVARSRDEKASEAAGAGAGGGLREAESE